MWCDYCQRCYASKIIYLDEEGRCPKCKKLIMISEEITMKPVKSFERIHKQLKDGKPLWLCLGSPIVSKMAIGWVDQLAENNMIKLPSENDLKNHEFMIVKISTEDAIKKGKNK